MTVGVHYPFLALVQRHLEMGDDETNLRFILGGR